jgi:ATP-dependent helicase HepA
MTNSFVPGQRWISDSEPELGLGTVLKVGEGRVLVGFSASQEQRQYSAESAPLRRVRFRAGETIAETGGASWAVARLEEKGGLVTYVGEDGKSVREDRLSAALGFGSPETRLLNGQTDPVADFNLRREALELQHRRRRSLLRGFVGGRMDLIPHQLYIAREVTGRVAPRVLLADEVGLGKTIEACLVIHRLLSTGRASRVLVVVPESLVHQWFVELLRRFNLWFHLFDEERCDAVEAADPGCNPFLEDQWVLCGLPLLLDPKRAAQAVDAGWDLLVVDEAHHLRWSPTESGPEYRVVEALSQRTEGLLLLTATPEQLGLASHFARLRLLDPARYRDLAAFEQESARFGEIASLANRLVLGESPTAGDSQRLRSVFANEPESVQSRMEELALGDATARNEVVAGLLDRHGPGRVMFRNTRAAMKGFPKRMPQPVPLAAAEDDPGLADRLSVEFECDGSTAQGDLAKSVKPAVVHDFSRDPRIVWLVDWLRASRGAKVLLICRTQSKVLAIDAALRARITVATALFHEGLELVQRDRNAAWFADPEGAQILLASEIGSEGRNFQFAQNLVLFDLPLDPELIEQRIGRLDRIGQSANIRIHVPHVAGTCQEVLFRWFHEGLDAFGHNLHAGREMLESFGREVRDLALDYHETQDSRGRELDTLVERTRLARIELERRLERGRDRLLELNSFRPAAAAEIVNGIAAIDREAGLEEFMLRVWDHFGVPVEDLGPRRFRIGADGVFADSFPGLPPEGLAVTFDRRLALSREDVAFLTWDHPMVSGALDLLTGGPRGSCACAVWPGSKESGLWLELVFLVECVAPSKLHADRFLPATPLRLVVDLAGREITAKALPALERAQLSEGPLHDLLDHGTVRDRIGNMVRAAEGFAQARSRTLIQSAANELESQMSREIERLRALAAVNPNVRASEIEGLESEFAELRQALANARVRLDAVRVLVLGEI